MSGSFARATAVSKHAASPLTRSVHAVAQKAVAERMSAAEKPERNFARGGVWAPWGIPANPPNDSGGARSSFGSAGELLLQRKLMVGSTTDPLEAEADQMAEHVLAERSVSVSGARAGSAEVVRRCACGTERNKTILRRATADVAPVEAPSIVHDVIRSSGRPLDDGLRRDMEDGFGFDFSRVRVHTEGAADAAARAIGAHAFTTGHNIVFANGQYAPTQTSGRRLIAHELAHVMQQGSAEATARIGRKPAKVAQSDLVGDAASRLRGVRSSIQLLALQRAAGNQEVTGLIQRAPNQSIDPLTLLTGESDIYAAPISDRPVEQMSKSEVDDEINRIERWIGKQNQSTPDVVKRENRLADLRQRQTELGAPVKAHRATPVVAVKPRCLTESLDITQMTRDEMAAELDSIVRFLRLGPSKSDIAKVTHFKNALEQALEGQREQENEEVRKRDIALALQPITTGNTYEDFRKVLTVIASIAPDPNNTAQAALHLPNGMTVPVSNDEAFALKTQAAQMIKKYAAQSESWAEDTYQAFEERRQKGKEHPIVHGLVKWAADVDDLDELEMFGKKEQARSMQAQIKGLANSGELIRAFNLSVALDVWSEGYARQVGEWEAALMNSAGRWVLGLTVLKEGLTLLATAGAGSLIGSARTARGISALRATAEVAGATTFAGTAGAVGGYAASEKLTGGEVTLGGAVKAGRVGGGTGLAIGAAPGAVAATKEAFGVGKAATTLGNVGRSVAAEVVGNTPVNVGAAGIQGESMKDAAISTVTSSTISGAGSQAVAKIAKGSKVVSTVAGAGVGGTAATAGALATGKDARDTVIAGAFGTAGGALGPHLAESNKNYLEGRSGGSSTEGAPKPPTTDERFDFSDTASGSGARSGGSAPPAESGVGGKFDLSDVGGSPPANPGSGPKAATTGTTVGTPTSSATSVTSQSSAPALTGSRRTSFGGPNEPPLPADVDIEGAVERGLSEHDADRRPYGEAPRPELSEVESAAGGASSPHQQARINAAARGQVDYGLPHPAAAAAARSRLRSGSGTPRDALTVIRQSVGVARGYMSGELGQGGLSGIGLAGRCMMARDITALSIAAQLEGTGVPASIRRYSVNGVAGRMTGQSHQFTVVEFHFPDHSEAFILDPTYAQFIRPGGEVGSGRVGDRARSGAGSAESIARLIEDGYVPLNPTTARIYLDSLVPQGNPTIDPARLLSGQGGIDPEGRGPSSHIEVGGGAAPLSDQLESQPFLEPSTEDFARASGALREQGRSDLAHEVDELSALLAHHGLDNPRPFTPDDFETAGQTPPP
jgi:hypothetical protein